VEVVMTPRDAENRLYEAAELERRTYLRLEGLHDEISQLRLSLDKLEGYREAGNESQYRGRSGAPANRRTDGSRQPGRPHGSTERHRDDSPLANCTLDGSLSAERAEQLSVGNSA
jgi:hypothetical protein